MSRISGRSIAILFGASMLAMAFPTAAEAQRGGGGSYIDIYWEEEPEEEKSEPAKPGSPPTMATYVVYPLHWTTPIETIKRPPPPPPKYKSESPFVFEDSLLDRVTAPALETFANDRDFQRYAEKLEKLKDDSDAEWAGLSRPILIAASMTQDMEIAEEECIDAQACPDEGGQNIVVTGARAASPSLSSVSAVSAVSGDSITNVQTSGVDEGDIVKQIGDYLLVLQDGRIFAVNIKSNKLTDRADVYRRLPKDRKKKHQWENDFEGADWYDEMLVQGDHILITAYSYDDRASEISVFKLDQASGKVSPRGVFLISSDDYYDVDNYATRIVGDRLVIYTPYELDQFEDKESRPYLRRWVSAAERKDGQAKGKPLLDSKDIYKPLLRTAEPFVHSISICPLGNFAKTATIDCRTTGFVGPRDAEMFVSNDNIYLWNAGLSEVSNASRDDCAPDWDWSGPHPALPRAKRKDVIPAAVYRLPVDGTEPAVVGVSGTPYDQFSMDERDGRFRALANWRTVRCEGAERAPAEVAFLSVHQSLFGREYVPVTDSAITMVPSPGKSIVENRFADDWLVYGGRDSWSSRPPEMEDKDEAARAALGTRLVAVPVRKPHKAQVIDLPHNIIRTERLGKDMIVNGYRDDKGMNMTLVDLGKTAQISSSLFLENRFESEGRSHAFNATMDASGAAVMGIPTVKRGENADRWWWNSETSDLSFVTKASAGTLGNAGALVATAKNEVETHPDYTCEVSCIDWYGNSRPIFTRGRIFGLMGTALVEAEMADGKIREKARIDLTVPLDGPSPGN
jgi:hypothetical protein